MHFGFFGLPFSWVDLLFLQVLKSPNPCSKGNTLPIQSDLHDHRIGMNLRYLAPFIAGPLETWGVNNWVSWRKSIKKSKKILFLMGTLKFQEVNVNHILTAIIYSAAEWTIISNYFFHWKRYFRGGREKKQTFNVSFVIYVLFTNGWVAILNLL